ncbi:MAG: hypothetical protein JKY46_10575 [Robiginitomaculum sp.]|nr:hypothetical protein [Robiginitomaculum sp.]
MSNISSDAQIGENCFLSRTAVIHENVILGDNCKVDDYCVLGDSRPLNGNKLVIGQNAIIRSHSVMYGGSTFGSDLSTGHHCLVREGISAGINLQIGSYNSLEGDTIIGDFVRFHSSVNIGRGSQIGDLVWIFPNVVLTNDPIPPSGLQRGVTLGDGVVICAMAIILPGAVLGVGAFVAACAKVGGEIPKGAFVVGEKGLVRGDVRLVRDFTTKKQHPWMNHFFDYYPQAAQEKIREIRQTLADHFCEQDEKRRSPID